MLPEVAGQTSREDRQASWVLCLAPLLPRITGPKQMVWQQHPDADALHVVSLRKRTLHVEQAWWEGCLVVISLSFPFLPRAQRPAAGAPRQNVAPLGQNQSPKIQHQQQGKGQDGGQSRAGWPGESGGVFQQAPRTNLDAPKLEAQSPC